MQLRTKYIQSTASLKDTDIQEVISCFNLLKCKSSCQEEDIPMFLWKLIVDFIITPVTFMANQMINEAHFPSCFKKADIMPIYKKGDKTSVKNYRPITILHNLSKIFERLILSRMNSFILKNNILPDHQFGFRPKYSTKDAVATLLLKVEENAIQNKNTCSLFLDLSKAFDTVNHEKLLKILFNLGFRGHFLRLLNSYLTDRYFRIKNNDTVSKYSLISNGVPQGSIISPLLYCLYVHNFSMIHNDIIQYADDTTIMISFSNIDDLQLSLKNIGNKIVEYMDAHNLIINAEKTEVMIFGKNNATHVNFLDKSLQVAHNVKFLGINIADSRKFNEHISNHIIPKIRSHFSIFHYLAKYLSKQDKVTVFKSFIFPHIIYASPFLLNSNIGQVKHLKSAYNRAMKILFRIPFLYPSQLLPQSTNIESLSSLILHHSLIYAYLIFHQQLPASVNTHFLRSRRLNFILKPHSSQISLHNTLCIEWNKLKHNIKTASSKACFKKYIEQS